MYFEETSRCSEDISNIYSNAETVSLRDGDSFKNFEEAEAHIWHFAKHKGFKVQLGHLKTVNMAENKKATRKPTILYKHLGLFKPKNSARQSTSTCIICPWHINLSRPLRDNSGFRFTEEMRQEVEFLVTKCQLGATMVQCILKKKFSSHLLFSKDLYIKIQRYQPSNNEDETNILTNLFWMSPEQILLWYEFGESIGHDNTVGTNRYNMLLSLFVAQDDNMQSCIITQAFEQLISFPNARLYLEHYLYEYQFSWACAFTATAFTLGIQSTSFVKSQNVYIKRVLESSNTSLCELNKVLIERNIEKQKQKQFEEWKQNTPSSTNVVTIFPAI
ncbi:18440_t:CDS:2, partial [Racocetra persica]